MYSGYEGDIGGYDSDCSNDSIEEDYYIKFIKCLTPRSKSFKTWKDAQDRALLKGIM
jgi:hypothetical protein